MKKFNKLIIACDGESASGKSTAAKLISKKYGLLLVNSGLLYRYASKLIIDHKPKNEVKFLRKIFDNAHATLNKKESTKKFFPLVDALYVSYISYNIAFVKIGKAR